VRAVCLSGMAWGDESKGSSTDALCRYLPVDVVVRYNGGCQASHAVVCEDGRSHIFSQFGAGMLANKKVRTHLSRFMLVEPFSMMKEAEALGKLTDNVWERTTVDGKSVVVTSFHRHLNRLREQARGISAHGSCGRGIGVAREMQIKYGEKVLLAGDLCDFKITADKLYESAASMLSEIMELEHTLHLEHAIGLVWKECQHIAHGYQTWPARIVDSMEPAECMVFEGAQGVLLDEKYGTAPHNTWTNTTFENADTLLDEVGCSDRFRIGCFRTYYTRHGAGPFPTENESLKESLPETHNGDTGFQGSFRVGYFDWELARKALGIVGRVDGIALSHMDCLPALGWREKDFLDLLSESTDIPVVMKGYGPTASHRKIEMEVMA
jgi:adenylosuccinate synthase